MDVTHFLICWLLILLSILALGGMFLVRNYIKKISLLSVSYVSFIILFVVLSQNKILTREMTSIAAVIFTVFSINLMLGIAMVKNISEK
jgi:hypothetical protein